MQVNMSSELILKEVSAGFLDLTLPLHWKEKRTIISDSSGRVENWHCRVDFVTTK
jgi:hypothetical protein